MRLQLKSQFSCTFNCTYHGVTALSFFRTPLVEVTGTFQLFEKDRLIGGVDTCDPWVGPNMSGGSGRAPGVNTSINSCAAPTHTSVKPNSHSHTSACTICYWRIVLWFQLFLRRWDPFINSIQSKLNYTLRWQTRRFLYSFTFCRPVSRF